MVKKGQVVAEFDRQYMLTRLDDYRASVAQSEASRKKSLADLEVVKKAREQNILAAKGALEKAKLDMKTLPVLGDIDVERTKLALEEAQARYNQLMREVRFYDASEKAQLRIADLSLEQSKSELKRAEANADRMVSKAPIDGLTVMQTIFRGSEMTQISQGDQLFPGQPFMSIVDPSSMVINASVNQTDVERLRIGQKARVRFDAYPDLELTARVWSVGGIPKTGGQRANWVKEIPVRFKFDKLDSRVIPDLSVSLDVIVESDEGAVVVPAGSLFRDPAGKQYVWVRSANGRFERRNVEIGLTSYTHAAIRSGLTESETVALEAPEVKAPPPGSPPTT